MSKKRIVIIGAGPAGLTAAYELLRRAGDFFEVIVLESETAVGGLAKAIVYNGKILDVGGHRFFSRDEVIPGWWRNIMPLQGKPSPDDVLPGRNKVFDKNGPDPQTSDDVMLVRDRYSSIIYEGKMFDYPVNLSFETLKKFGLTTAFAVSRSYIKESISQKKRIRTLEDYYRSHFGEKLYSMFFEGYTEKVWGKHPAEISPDWGVQRIKGLTGVSVVIDGIKNMLGKRDENTRQDSLIKSFMYPKYGPGQFWEKVAQEVTRLGGYIITDCRVTGLLCKGRQAKTAQCLVKGQQMNLSGDVFMSSMPISELINSMTGVTISQNTLSIANGLPYRSLISVGIEAKRINLPENEKVKTLNGISPDCWLYVQDRSVKIGRIQIYNNWSPYLSPNSKERIWLAAEIFCNENDMFWNMNENQITEMAIRDLEKLGLLNRSDVTDRCAYRIAKAYPAYFGTYEEFGTIRRYLDEFSNLYCIGRNGQHKYYNMDQAMMTAIEAVSNILVGSGDKSNVWDIEKRRKY